MRLEYRCNLLSPVQFADRYHALTYLGRMMGIVRQENGLIALQAEIETPVHSSERSHALLYLFRCHAADLRQGHGRYPVLDIDAYGNAQLHILDMP